MCNNTKKKGNGKKRKDKKNAIIGNKIFGPHVQLQKLDILPMLVWRWVWLRSKVRLIIMLMPKDLFLLIRRTEARKIQQLEVIKMEPLQYKGQRFEKNLGRIWRIMNNLRSEDWTLDKDMYQTLVVLLTKRQKLLFWFLERNQQI